MPRIEEYNPTVEAQGPVGGLDPRVEAAAAIGRSVEKFGNTVESAGDLINRRQVQADTSDIYAKFADMREDYSTKIADGMAKGDLNVDKIKEDYQKEVSDYSETITTSAGQNYLQRQAARLQGTILKKAAFGQAQLVGIQETAKFTDGITKNSSALMSDPTQFDDTMFSTYEHIDQMIKSKAITPAAGQKLLSQAETELAAGTVRGFAKQNPDEAKKMLDAGQFDDFFNSDQKKTMYGEVRIEKTRAEVEKKQNDSLAQDAQDKAAEAFKQYAVTKLSTISPREIVNSPLTADEKVKWLNIADSATRRETKTDPKVFRNLMMKVVNGDITDAGDPAVMGALHKNQLNPSDLPKLTTFMNKTPEGQAALAEKKQMLSMAKQQIIGKDSLTGQSDPKREQYFSNFISDLQDKEEDMRKQGLSPREIYDPKSPNYFGTQDQLNKYKRSPQEIMQDMAQGLKPQASPTPSPTPGASPNDNGEVSVKLKSGKTAIYDSKTKKLLRTQ